MIGGSRSWKAGAAAIAGILAVLGAPSSTAQQSTTDAHGLTPTASLPGASGTNAIEQLQAALEAGEIRLESSSDGRATLVGILDALGILPESQLLVFSGSSLQFDKIEQATPRSIFHNEDVAVGWVQNSSLLEIITSGAERVAFYTLDTSAAQPRFQQRFSECIICHGFATRWAAGYIVANTDTGEGGNPLLIDPLDIFRLTDQRTPFDERYGGWYITGETAGLGHRGNVTLDYDDIYSLMIPTVEMKSLDGVIDTDRHLEPGSDIVSMLTLEHQSGFANLAAQINAQYRGLDPSAVSDPRLLATPADIDTSIEELVRYMTFANEVPLPAPVVGSSDYATLFTALGPRDPQGRSLRELDLQTSVFRYPLSYMVYSDAFDHLNEDAKARIWRRLYDVLSGADPDPAFARARENGQEAIAILAATKGDVPDYWR